MTRPSNSAQSPSLRLSGRATRLGKPQEVDADITGAQQLRLVTTDGGDNTHCGHAAWAEARIE